MPSTIYFSSESQLLLGGNVSYRTEREKHIQAKGVSSTEGEGNFLFHKMDRFSTGLIMDETKEDVGGHGRHAVESPLLNKLFQTTARRASEPS